MESCLFLEPFATLCSVLLSAARFTCHMASVVFFVLLCVSTASCLSDEGRATELASGGPSCGAGKVAVRAGSSGGGSQVASPSH